MYPMCSVYSAVSLKRLAVVDEYMKAWTAEEVRFSFWRLGPRMGRTLDFVRGSCRETGPVADSS